MKGKIATEEYQIHWRGALFAPETGDYDFDLDTTGGGRLFLNDEHRPLIDAWVRSGGESDHRATIRLLGGRTYPIHVDYVKGKGEAARVALKWKPPLAAEEVVPAHCLLTPDVPEVFVLQTPLPADDRSAGYERGTTVSKQWEQAITDAAIEVAGRVSTRFRRQPGMAEESLGHDAKTREFCRRFVERAFRRPLTDAQRQLYIDRRFLGAADLDTAVRRVVLFALISPRFLYVPTDDAPQAVANRLALALWDSLPDDALRQAAANGRLKTDEQLRQQARRMLADPRAATKLRLFFLQWMKVETPPELSKDPKSYAAFDAAVAADLRTSLKMFVEDVMWDKASDFRQLLLADDTYMNGRLAAYYGVKMPADADFRKVAFEPEPAGGHPLASVPDGRLRPRGGYLADPARRVYHSRRAGPGAASAADGHRPARGRIAAVADDPPARRATDPAGSLPVVPCDDQSPRLCPGAVRRLGPASAARERPANRRQRLLPYSRRPGGEVHRRAVLGRVPRRQRRGPSGASSSSCFAIW